MDVEQAIQATVNGQIDCYEIVVREYQGRLRAFIAAYCPDQSQIDDIAQRTFIWAYEHLRDYRSGTRF